MRNERALSMTVWMSTKLTNLTAPITTKLPGKRVDTTPGKRVDTTFVDTTLYQHVWSMFSMLVRTYNYGAVLRGLVYIYQATNSTKYLREADAIARAAMADVEGGGLSVSGILREPCDTGKCDSTAELFKVRY
jgi:hypothetical protein